MKNSVTINDEIVQIIDIYGKSITYDLDKYERIFVVGGGKAGLGMIKTLFELFGNKITKSIMNVPSGKQKFTDKKLKVFYSGHPIPDEIGLVGTQQIVNLLKAATKKDLIFILLSGGGSALMPLPYSNLELNDKKIITAKLLSSGASIEEINTIRKHISGVKGGRLIEFLEQGCSVCCLILSDVIGDRLDIIASGPTVPDCSTYLDAIDILKKYNIWHDNSTKEVLKVKEVLVNGLLGNLPETPKIDNPKFKDVNNFIIGNNSILKKSISAALKEYGICPQIIEKSYSGEIKYFAKELLHHFLSNKSKKSFAMILGGETVVKLNEENIGKGGRNQETILSVGLELTKIDLPPIDFSIACFGSDGIDGNSEAAGALLTPNTLFSLKCSKLEAQGDLDNHNSNKILNKINSVLITGYTGTNVNDVTVICKI